MAWQRERIEFVTARDVQRHLDAWADRDLRSPEGWQAAALSSQAWLDYSPRNEVLLASYGTDGAVAGQDTWSKVPAATGDRGCAVRAREHPLPVRVPITVAGAEPDPFLGGHRPTRAAVERWEWRGVYCEAQLARRPDPGAFSWPALPEELSGPAGDEQLLTAARAVATKTVRGRLGPGDEPGVVLAEAAHRLRRGERRPPLEPVLAAQVAWLVLDRVDRAAGPLPPFDPAALEPRERWERLVDVLTPARQLAGGLGREFGADLLASPVPRQGPEDDRVVPAGRRNVLPRASLAQLPVAQWVVVGPYSSEEWAARGEVGSGRGAYLRINASAYLVAVERGAGEAAWRLEDVRDRTRGGVLAEGSGESLLAAQGGAIAAMEARYPTTMRQAAVLARSEPVLGAGWVELRDGDVGLSCRDLGAGVTAFVLPVREGWQPAIRSRSGAPVEALEVQADRDRAMAAAEQVGQEVALRAEVVAPAQFDAVVAALADSGRYDRAVLVDLVAGRLDRAEVDTLSGEATPAQLVEVLGAAGVTPATTVAVLRAEGVDAGSAAALLPVLGVGTADAIQALHARWGMERGTAAELVAASPADMRAAGCSPSEILAARPAEALAGLPEDPAVWGVAAGEMRVGGLPAPVVVDHLVARAPTPDAFATGMASTVDHPDEALSLAVRAGAGPEQLAAMSELYGLSPMETIARLHDAGAETGVAVGALARRCDGDVVLTTQIARSALGLRTEQVASIMGAEGAGMTVDADALRNVRPLSRDREAWVAAHRPGPAPPWGSAEMGAADLLAVLPAPAAPDSGDVLPPASLGNGVDGARLEAPDPQVPEASITEVSR